MTIQHRGPEGATQVRRQTILAMLRSDAGVTLSELAGLYGVSEIAATKWLHALKDEGLARGDDRIFAGNPRCAGKKWAKVWRIGREAL